MRNPNSAAITKPGSLNKMTDARAELWAGALVLAVAAGFAAFAFDRGGMSRDSYELRASFPSVDGISVGTDVRLAGVRVGRITSITLNPVTYFADATLSVPRAITLPADSAVLISQEGLLGGNYIELQPGGSPDDLQPGDEIEDVQGSVSLVNLLMKFVDSQSSDGGSSPDKGVLP